MAGYREQRRSRRERRRRVPRASVLAMSMAVAPAATRALAPVAMPHVAHVPRSTHDPVSVPDSSSKLRAIMLPSPPSRGRRRCESCGRSSGCLGARGISLCGERRVVQVSLKMAAVGEDDRIREHPGVDLFSSGGDCFAPEQEDSSSARRLRQGLRRLGRLRKPENVLEFLAAAKARDGSISLRAFNVAIAAVAACEGASLYALKLLALMEEESVSPDRFSFTAVVASCCRCQQWQLAFRILAEMNRRGLRPLNLRASRFTTAPGEAGNSARDSVLCFLQGLRRSPKLPLTPSEDTPVLLEYEGVIGRRISLSWGKIDEKEKQEQKEEGVGGGGGGEEAGGVAKDDDRHRQEKVNRNGIGGNRAADRVLVGAMYDCVKVAGGDGNEEGETYTWPDDDGGILRHDVDNSGSMREGVENDGASFVTGIGGSEGIAGADARTRTERRRAGDVAGGESTAGSNSINKRSAINGEGVGSVTTITTTTTKTTAATTIVGAGASGACDHGIAVMLNSREGDCGGADVSVEDIVAAGGLPEEDVFLSELKAAALKKDAAAALRILDCMRQAGHAPHQGAYACAIRACGKAGKWEQSLALMDEIGAAGMQPGQGCHIMALKACAASGRWEETLEMLGRMSERGIDRPENAFAIAMKACGEAGRWREALGLMEEMRRDGVLPMETAYCTAMKACGRAGEWRQALVLFNEMRTAGIPPTEQCFTAVIKSCANAGETKEALSLLKQMRSAPAVSTNNAVYRAIIFACCKAGNWPLAVGLLEDARREQLKPETGDLRAVVQACGKAGQYERALSLLEEMRSEGMHMRRTGEKLWWLFNDCADVRVTRRAWALMEVEETRARLEQRAQRNAAAKPSGDDCSSTTATIKGSVSAATHVTTGVKTS